MKIIFLVFLYFSCVTSVICQSILNQDYNLAIENFIEKGDSLKGVNASKALFFFKNGLAIALDNNLNTQAAICYKKIGVLYHKQQSYIKAESNYQKGVALDSTSKIAADLNYNISLLKSKLNQQDSLLIYLKRSINLYEQFALSNSSYKAFLKAGKVYREKQLYEEALNYAIRAFDGFKENGNKEKLADASICIGNIQNQLKNHNQALIYHYLALDIENELNNSLGKGICYTNIANVYDDLGVKDSTLVNYKRALKLLSNSSSQYAVLLSNLATAYKAYGEKKLSKQYFIKSIELNKSQKDTTSLLYSYNGIASLYIEHFNLKSVKTYLNQARALIPSVTDQRAILSYYENEAEYYKQKQEYKKALKFYKQYSNLYKTVYDSEQAKVVQNLQYIYESQRKENEILKLKFANDSAQSLLVEKSKNLKTRNLVLVILIVVLILLVVIYQYILQKQKTTIQAAKLEKLEENYKGQETIKKRIARDLHDIITTNFDGLRLRVLALKRSKNLDKTIDGITNDFKKINQQIRTISHRLYPLELYMGKQKFTGVIRSRLSEFQLYTNIFVELKNQLPDLLDDLPLSIQNNFYGILLETLNNVEKHALATKISIKNYTDNNGNLNFEIEDNGIGIKRNHKQGIGLMNIKQRVEIIEGISRIYKTETGTLVHVNFPVKEFL